MPSIGQRVASGRRVTSVPSDRPRRLSKRRAPATETRTSPSSRQIATVVVVDDDSSVLPALARLIRAAGFAVRTFDRPSALLASEVPKTNACMLVDLHLPEMNGVELCKALGESGRGLPAIMITGRSDAETRRLLEHADSVATLSKPVDEQVLLAAIKRALACSTG